MEHQTQQSGGAAAMQAAVRTAGGQSRTAYQLAVEQVTRAFPARGYVDWKEGCNYICMPLLTANDQLSTGRFPLSVVRQGVKKLIPVLSLIEYDTRKYLELGYPADPDQPAPARPVYMPQELPPASNGRGRGRLRKGAESLTPPPVCTTQGIRPPGRLGAAGRPTNMEKAAAEAAGYPTVTAYRRALAAEECCHG